MNRRRFLFTGATSAAALSVPGWLATAFAAEAKLTDSLASVSEAYRAAHAGRMRAWTWLGIGTHFAVAYVLTILGYWWPEAVAIYFLGCATVVNLLLGAMLWLERRQVCL